MDKPSSTSDREDSMPRGTLKPEEGDDDHDGDIDQYYEIDRVIGRGEFSTVYYGVHRDTGEKFAIKKIAKSGTKLNSRLKTEVEILKRVKHSNITKLHEVFDSDTYLYLVIELVTGGELFNKIVERGFFTEEEVRCTVKQILQAVAYLHSLHIAHRDLKPTNLLLKDETSMQVKIADFGLSKVYSETSMMQTACGTPIYVAPEVLHGDGYKKEVDVWSVGIIMYILLCGFPPFFDDGDEEGDLGTLFEQILTGKFDYPEEYWGDISDEAKDLINHLLVVNPKKRYTAKQALKHPWIRKRRTGRKKKKMDMKKMSKAGKTAKKETRDAALTMMTTPSSASSDL